MDKEAADAAALALRHLCDACGAAMAPHLDALMSLYQRIQSAGQATTSAAVPSAPAAVEEANVQQVGSPLLMPSLTLVFYPGKPETHARTAQAHSIAGNNVACASHAPGACLTPEPYCIGRILMCNFIRALQKVGRLHECHRHHRSLHHDAVGEECYEPVSQLWVARESVECSLPSIHVQVVEALALVVSALPADQRKAGLKALLSPVVAALRGCLEQELRTGTRLSANGHAMNGSAGHPAQPIAADLSQTLPLVDRMTIIFRCACAGAA